MGDEMATGLALCQASEQIDGKIAEIESLLLVLVRAHRNHSVPAVDRDTAMAERR